MIPRFVEFTTKQLIKYRAPLIGSLVGAACLYPALMSFGINTEFSSINMIDYANMGTGALTGFVTGYHSSKNGNRTWDHWRQFQNERLLFRNGINAWPRQFESTFHRSALHFGARAGAMIGVGIYLFGSVVVVFGAALGGDPPKAANLMREWTTYMLLLSVLTGGAVGAIGGGAMARIATSRMLWG